MVILKRYWLKAYIEFEKSEGKYERTRALYERLLDWTKQLKVWISYVKFEAFDSKEDDGGSDISEDDVDEQKKQSIQRARIQILSKSKLEKCEKSTDTANLNCTTKIVLNLTVPSGSSGGEASIVAEVVEVEKNSTQKMLTLRIPLVLTINESASYVLYELTYIRVQHLPCYLYM
ncbi:hypothetical protein Q3G72_012827 [Acer saccharum]|nr:hypothetical protein Q3G72_012827 [Acer saccharum]